MAHHHKQTHSHRQTTHTLIHTQWRTYTHAHRNMYKKAWICSTEEFIELYGKVEAMVRNCLLRWSGHLVEVALNKLAFLCSDRSIFPLVPSFSLLHQRFYVQKWGNFEPFYLSNESKFWKIKKVFLPYGPRNVPQKFQISAMIRKYRSDQTEQLVLLIDRAEVG